MYPLAFIGQLLTGDVFVFAGLFVAALLLLNLTAIALLRLLSFLSGKTKTDLDDRLIASLKVPFHVFASATALYLSLDYSFPELAPAGVKSADLFVIFIYALVAVALNRVIDIFLVWYGREIVPNTKSKVDDEVFPLIRNVVKVLVFLVFAVFILDKLGVQIAPLLAGLGIAGIAVGLALQDSLTNFFAGLHILTDKPFKEGDFIGLENGASGSIVHIGWRSTKIRTMDNNYVIVPNSKLAQNILTNYYAPDQQMQIVTEIGVSYDEDVNEVESVILQTLKSVQQKNEFFSKSQGPWVRLDRFGDYALIFRYGYFVTAFDKRFDASKEPNRDLFYAFKANGIEIPFPVRTIIQKKEGKKAGRS